MKILAPHASYARFVRVVFGICSEIIVIKRAEKKQNEGGLLLFALAWRLASSDIRRAFFAHFRNVSRLPVGMCWDSKRVRHPPKILFAGIPTLAFYSL